MTDQSISWRLPLALPNLFSIIVLLFIFFLPESPRWLIKVGRYQEATEIMSKLKDLPIDSSEIINEVNEMRSALDESVTQKATLKDMFTMGPDKLFFRFCLCILLQFYQQMSGANLISVYGTVIFEQSLDIQSQKAKLLTGGALTWKFFSSFLAFFTIDRFGRRALFMFSGSGSVQTYTYFFSNLISTKFANLTSEWEFVCLSSQLQQPSRKMIQTWQLLTLV